MSETSTSWHRVDDGDVPGEGRVRSVEVDGHTTLHNPDWAEYARLCGATGIRVDRREQLDDALTALFAADGPALLCVQQDAQLL